MKVVLTTDVAQVGRRGEIIDVSDGYALNFLIPQQKARFATTEAEAEVRKEKGTREAHTQARDEEILAGLDTVASKTVAINARANEDGGLFAAVPEATIIQAINDQHNVALPQEAVVLEEQIKKTGEHSLTFAWKDKQVEVTLIVSPDA